MQRFSATLILFLSILLVCPVCAFADGAPSGCWTVQEITRDGAVLDLSGTASSFALSPQQLCSLELLPSGSGRLLFLGVLYPVELRSLENSDFALTDSDSSFLLSEAEDGRFLLSAEENLVLSLAPVSPSVLSFSGSTPVSEVLSQQAADQAKVDAILYDASHLTVSFSEEETRAMSRFMLQGRYWSDGSALFGMAFDKNSSLPDLICTAVDLTDALPSLSPYTVLDRHVNATFLTSVPGGLVFIRHDRDADTSSLARLNLESLTVEILTGNIPSLSYLSFHNNRLYFAGENHHYYSSALDGSDITPILEKEVYYPYFLSDDWLLYQDSADNESFHLFRLSDGADVSLTSVPSFLPVISGSILYFLTQQEDNLLHLSRIDFSKPSSSPDTLYDLEVSPLPSYGEFFISGNTLYGCNQLKTDLPRWKQFSDYTPDALPSFRTFYADNSFLVSIEMDDYQGGNIRSIYLQDVFTGKEAVFPHVY